MTRATVRLGFVCTLLVGCTGEILPGSASGSGSNAGSRGGNTGNASGGNVGSAGKGGSAGSASASAGGTGGSGVSAGGTETGSCELGCDDGNSCTADVATGEGDGCVCSHEVVSECVAGDGCCAAGCTSETDSDCSDPTVSPIPDERRIEWKPGIPGGIPEVTEVCARVDAEEYGDGSTDATSAIQDAIDDCPAGQAVVLPAGTYRTTGMLRIEKSIVLRGEGADRSKIVLDNGGTEGVLRIGKQTNLGSAVSVLSGMDKGSSEITVADASDYAVGDVILIDQKDDTSLIKTGDCQWFKRSDGGARSLGQTVRITAKNGDTLTLSSPLYYSYQSSFDPEITKPSGGTLFHAGVEDLYLSRKTSYGGQGFIIHMAFTAESWVKGVETEKVSGRHIAIQNGYRVVVRDSYVHHAWDYNPGANAYGISINSDTSDSLIENNIVYYLNIPMVFENSGGGNVVGYNYIDDAIEGDAPSWQCADIVAHCSFSYMELVEGNYAPHVTLDNVHGGSGYITFFRNHHSSEHLTLEADGNQLAFGLEANALYHNAVGNVFLKEGLPKSLLKDNCSGSGPFVYQFGFNNGNRCSIDQRVEETVLLHGNFDFVNNAVVWADDLSHEMPPSLYLTQKPSFFGDRPWPYVDPERSPMVGSLPAKQRYEASQ